MEKEVVDLEEVADQLNIDVEKLKEIIFTVTSKNEDTR